MFRQLYIILLFIFVAGLSVSFGQDNPVDKKDSIQHTIVNSVDKTDSLADVSIEKIDSIQSLLKLDTLQEGLSKFNSISDKVDSKLDSLNPVNKLQGVNSKIDSINSSLNSRVDSLKSLNLGGNKITGKMDSLKMKLDSMKANGPLKKASEAKEKIESTNEMINDAESKINDKLGIFKKESDGVGTMPGDVNLPNAGGVNTPDLSNLKPDINLNVENPIDNVEGPQLDNIEGVNKSGSIIPGVDTPQLNSLDGLQKLNDAKDKIGEVSEITGKVGEYGEDINNIKGGNLGEVKAIPRELENGASNIESVKGLKSEMDMGEKSVKDLEKLMDPEEARKLAMEKAAKEAVNYFAGHDQGLTKAMANMNKYKKKYPNLQSTKDLPKHKPNEMKSRPFIERIVPFSTFQIQLIENLLLDINPGVSYRWTGRLSVGLGWNERIGMDISEGKYFIEKERIYGPRSFVQFRVKENYHFKLEYELMNAVVPPNYIGKDVGTRQWISGWFLGAKKDFKFTKNINGNVQFFYNLFDRYHMSPYMDRINARFGIEIPLRKKVKEEDLSSN